MLLRASNSKTRGSPILIQSGKQESPGVGTLHSPHSAGWVADGKFEVIFLAQCPLGSIQCIILNSNLNINSYVRVWSVYIYLMLCGVTEVEAACGFSSPAQQPWGQPPRHCYGPRRAHWDATAHWKQENIGERRNLTHRQNQWQRKAEAGLLKSRSRRKKSGPNPALAIECTGLFPPLSHPAWLPLFDGDTSILWWWELPCSPR